MLTLNLRLDQPDNLKLLLSLQACWRNLFDHVQRLSQKAEDEYLVVIAGHKFFPVSIRLSDNSQDSPDPVLAVIELNPVSELQAFLTSTMH